MLASSAARLMTTFLPSTRTMLGMASYKALPARFASIHPKYLTPGFGTIIAGIIAGTFYTVLTFVSESVLFDTILSLGLMICFYYGLTAIGCIWYFRKELFTSFYNFIFKFLFPLLGGLGLWFVFFVTIRDSADPEYSGSEHLRRRNRAGARSRIHPVGRGLHVHLAGEGAGLLQRRNAASGHPDADHPGVSSRRGPAQEHVLQGTAHRRVVRVGDTVRRPLTPWSRSVHRVAAPSGIRGLPVLAPIPGDR